MGNRLGKHERTALKGGNASLISTYLDFVMRCFADAVFYPMYFSGLQRRAAVSLAPKPIMEDPLINPSIDLKGRRILAVDDDRINLRIIGGILRNEGYEIAEAASGEQALEVYATRSSPTWCSSTS
jgi:hypothetical protein